MQPRRLDNSYFKNDLMDFLNRNSGGEDIRGSYLAVFNWIKEYDLQIAKNFEDLLKQVRDLFPTRYVTITPASDGSVGSYIINVYGVRSDEEYRKNHDILYTKVEKIEKEMFDDCGIFLIHNIALKDTVKYYPDETQKLIEFGFVTKQECDVLLEYINEEELKGNFK